MNSQDFLSCDSSSPTPPSPPQSPPPSPPQSPPTLEFEDDLPPNFSWSCPPSPTSVAIKTLDLAECLEKSCKIQSKTSKSNKKSVTFSNVIQIRTHQVVLGNHPFCRGGMALELGWEHDETELVDLDLFDKHSQHRRMGQLYLNFYRRRHRLRAVTGMTGPELLRAEYAMCCHTVPAITTAAAPLHRTPTTERIAEC